MSLEVAWQEYRQQLQLLEKARHNLLTEAGWKYLGDDIWEKTWAPKYPHLLQLFRKARVSTHSAIDITLREFVPDKLEGELHYNG